MLLILLLFQISNETPSEIYDLLKKDNTYKAYICKNIIPKLGERCEITKLDNVMLSEEPIIKNIANDIELFYRFAENLQGNQKAKQDTLINLQKLSKLHYDSYDNFINYLQTNTIRYAV